MSVRFSSALALTLVLAACTNGAPSDRYAFWRDDSSATPQGGHKPNLGDVPAQPDVAQAKTDMEAVRQRLVEDRDAAYQAYNNDPMMNNNAAPAAPAITSQPMAPPTPQNWSHGNVMYNYDSSSRTSTNTNPYLYGYSHVQIQQQLAQQTPPAPVYSGDDPSISIDWSALGGGAPQQQPVMNEPQMSTVMVGQPVVMFKYGSSQLNAHDKKTLRTIADEIKNGGKSVIVIGHASKHTGLSNVATSRTVNLKMSTHRAAAVLKELVRLGVSADKIKLAAYGDTMPTGGDDSADQRAEIVFND